MRRFETVSAVFCDGFVPGRGLRREHDKKTCFAERNFAPSRGKRPEYTLLHFLILVHVCFTADLYIACKKNWSVLKYNRIYMFEIVGDMKMKGVQAVRSSVNERL